MTVRLSVETRSPPCAMWFSRPSQTVGTPAAMVTRSPSIKSYTDLPSSAAPGNTSFAPVMAAA